MVDNLSPEKRTKIMKSIISDGTKPELVFRKYLFSQGFRYRKNYKKLPGRPDIVFIKKKIAIFVHGCFWHQHKNCKRANIPKSNKEYWVPKIERNKARDKQNIAELKKLKWKVLVVWECEVKKLKKLTNRLNKQLQDIPFR